MGSDCRHGLDESWCALCNNTDFQAPNKVPEDKQCLVPGCARWARESLGGIKVCHYHGGAIRADVHGRRYRVPYEETERARALADRLDWVYFIRLGRDMVKIGHTVNVLNRFRTITNYTFGELLSLEAGDRSLEKRLHRRFRGLSMRGDSGSVEMFSLGEPILEYIGSKRRCATGCRAKAMADDVVCEEHVGFMPGTTALVGMTGGPPNGDWHMDESPTVVGQID